MTYAQCKYALCFNCKNEQIMRANSVVEKLLHDIAIDFWKWVGAANT